MKIDITDLLANIRKKQFFSFLSAASLCSSFLALITLFSSEEPMTKYIAVVIISFSNVEVFYNNTLTK